MALTLQQIVMGFADGIRLADQAEPQATNSRSKVRFRPGIGPHSEVQTVRLVMKALADSRPLEYGRHDIAVQYPGETRTKCDLCLGDAPSWEWAIEVKMLRFLGDNGKANDNILMHILSPYVVHRSSLTDCDKLVQSGLAQHKAVLIYGYDHLEWPLDPAIHAFETLARARVELEKRCCASFSGLVHPIHASGRVFAWEVLGRMPPV